MDSVKPKSQRRVAPYGEEAMRRVSVRFTQEQIAALRVIGSGNVSLGVRLVIEKSEARERTRTREESEKLLKKYELEKTQKKIKKPLATKPTGRPAIANETLKKAQEMLSQGRSIKEIELVLKIHKSTIYKYLDVKKTKISPPQ